MRRPRQRPISEINVTPFVDVMLVLLIIFMVTAPLIQQGIDVELPKTHSEGLKSVEDALVITVKRDGTLYVQSAEVPMKELEAKLEKIFTTRESREPPLPFRRHDYREDDDRRTEGEDAAF